MALSFTYFAHSSLFNNNISIYKNVWWKIINESTNKILPVQDVCKFLYLCDLENVSVLLLHSNEEIYEKRYNIIDMLQ